MQEYRNRSRMKARSSAVVAVFLVSWLLSARAGTDTKYEHMLFDVYPGALAYVREANGNLTIAFVHNLDVADADFAAVAVTNDGDSRGNWDNRSVAAPAGQVPLIRLAGNGAEFSQTTVTFHNLSLAKVKVFHVMFFNQTPDAPDRLVILDPTLNLSSSQKRPVAPLTATIDGTIVTLSNGLKLEGQSGLEYTSKDGAITEVTATGGTVKSSDGVPLLKAGRIKCAFPRTATTQPG